MKRVRWSCAQMLVVLLSAIGILSAWPSHALARRRKSTAAPVRVCVDDYKSALKLEADGRLISARERFVRCSKAACGSTLRLECATRFTQLDSEIPSVVPLATDAEGAPRLDVEVKMDGQVLTDKLDGRAWPLDPGPHQLSFSADGAVFATEDVLVVQGQRNRTVQATLTTPSDKRAARPKKPTALAAAAAAPAAKVAREAAEREAAEDEEGGAAEGAPVTVVARGPPPSRSHAPVLTYVFAGTGLAGLGGFGLLTYWGRKDADLLGSCTPHCPQSSESHVKRLYVISDVSLGVGVAALAGAYWAYAHARASGNEESGSETAYSIGVLPTATGAVGTVSRTF